MKILIMAGGKGTRLWPLSRNQKPKQFQKLVSDRTLLQDTFFRLKQIASDINDIYVATNERYYEEVAGELPELNKENIIKEPANRDTASCVALACAIIGKKTPDETLVILPSDHLIKKTKNLIKAIQDADKFLENNPDMLLTLAIIPASPDTGFGYIQKNSLLSAFNKTKIYSVKRFVEKPDSHHAKEFIKSGNYFWNAGIYIGKIRNLIEQYKNYIPDTYKTIKQLQEAVGTEKFDSILTKEYCQMDKISFDYGISENVKNFGVIPADLGWSDIGSWAVLKDSLVKRNNRNFVKAAHLDIGSKDLLVYGSPKKLIATVGLKGLIIVDTPDVILICDKSQSQDVKKIVAMLEKTNGEKHL